jgi:hypothetical protein
MAYETAIRRARDFIKSGLAQRPPLHRADLINEVSEMIAAGVADDLSPDEIADNVLLTIDLIQRDTLSDTSTVQPHAYSPDAQAMGDCRVCGHSRAKPWHTDTSTVRAAIDPLAGLAERLDRLFLTSTEDNRRFVLATESAQNIVEIVREWIRSDAGVKYSVSSPERK